MGQKIDKLASYSTCSFCLGLRAVIMASGHSSTESQYMRGYRRSARVSSYVSWNLMLEAPDRCLCTRTITEVPVGLLTCHRTAQDHKQARTTYSNSQKFFFGVRATVGYQLYGAIDQQPRDKPNGVVDRNIEQCLPPSSQPGHKLGNPSVLKLVTTIRKQPPPPIAAQPRLPI